MKSVSSHLALAFALPFVLGSFAQASEDCSGENGACNVTAHDANTPVMRSELQQAIHDYLMENPKDLIDAMQAYQRKQAIDKADREHKALAAAGDELYGDPRDGVLGNPHGDVTVVEFFDNQCPWCHKLAPAIEELVKSDPNVRVVLKEYVLPGPGGQPYLGDGSMAAAKAALAVKNQGQAAYAAFHQALMVDDTPEHKLELGHIVELARASKVDTDRMLVEMNAPEILAHITSTQALAGRIGATATPGVIVGGALSQARDLAGLQAAVKNARAGAPHSAQVVANQPPQG